MIAIAVALLVLILQFSCGGRQEQPEITVHAATSLADAMQEIAQKFEESGGVKVRLNLASSGILQKHIEGGAPGDVFVSAGPDQVNVLEAKGLIDKSTRCDLLRNRIIVVLPAVSDLQIDGAGSLADERIRHIAIGDPAHVPAGKYAKEALEKTGVWDKVKDRVVPALSVRAALAAVESGDAEAGVIFQTDAAVSRKVKAAWAFPAETHSPIVYPAVVLARSEQPQLAAKFIEFLKGDTAAAIFKKYGFDVIEH